MVQFLRKRDAVELTLACIILFGPILFVKAAPINDNARNDVISTETMETEMVVKATETLPSNLFASTEKRNCSPRASESFPDDFFTWEEKRRGYIICQIMLAIYAFGALAMVCSYYFMSSLETICNKWNLSHDVAGATFMAIGTSAPELATSVIGVFITESNVGLDTVAGSTVYNMFFITALVALASSSEVLLSRYPILRDSTSFSFTAVVLMSVCSDGVITWYESIIIVVTYLLYILLMVFNSRTERALSNCITRRPSYCGHDATCDGGRAASCDSAYDTDDERRGLLSSPKQITLYDDVNDVKMKRAKERGNVRTWSTDSTDSLATQISQMNNNHLSRTSSLFSLHKVGTEEEDFQSPLKVPDGCLSKLAYFIYLPFNVLLFLTIPDCNRPGFWRHLYGLTFVMSVCWIGGLSYLLVWMVEVIGETFFIPESIMGITFLAVGTSIPDTLASVMAARRGYNDMAVSNILGSNLLDLTSSGLPWMIKTCFLEPGSTVFVGTDSITFTLASLLTAAVVIVVGFILAKWKLVRNIGYIYGSLYAIYVVICCLYELNYFGAVNLPMCPDD